MQKEELHLQRTELELTRKEVEKSAEAQTQLVSLQTEQNRFQMMTRKFEIKPRFDLKNGGGWYVQNLDVYRHLTLKVMDSPLIMKKIELMTNFDLFEVLFPKEILDSEVYVIKLHPKSGEKFTVYNTNLKLTFSDWDGLGIYEQDIIITEKMTRLTQPMEISSDNSQDLSSTH